MSAIDLFKEPYELLSNLRRVHAIYMYVNEYVLYMWSCDILIQMDAKRGKAGAMISKDRGPDDRRTKPRRQECSFGSEKRIYIVINS